MTAPWSGKAEVVVVPGLAVRGYAQVAVDALQRRGVDAKLLTPPAWRDAPADLQAYGRWVAAALHAAEVSGSGRVKLLIGLSVGTEAAAVAAAGGPVDQLLLVSPTVPPSKRGMPPLFATWMAGEHHRDSPSLLSQVPDWTRAGIPRIFTGFRSATKVKLEEVLSSVSAAVTIVHADHDHHLSDLNFAASLAQQSNSRLIVMPDAPHSWPVGDADRFVELVLTLLSGDVTSQADREQADSGE